MKRIFLVENPDASHVKILDEESLELRTLTHAEVAEMYLSGNYKIVNITMSIITKNTKFYDIRLEFRQRYRERINSLDAVIFNFNATFLGKRLLVSDDLKTYLYVSTRVDVVLYFGDYLYELNYDTFNSLHTGIDTSYYDILKLGIENDKFVLKFVYYDNTTKLLELDKNGNFCFNKNIKGSIGKRVEASTVKRRLILGGMLC